MDEKRKPRKKAGAAVAVVLLLLPVLYVASAGPAVAMALRRNVDCDTYTNSRGFFVVQGFIVNKFPSHRLWINRSLEKSRAQGALSAL